MRHQLVVRKARVVKPDGIFPSTLVVDDGQISGIARYSDAVSADEEIDADGRFVLPGAIDPHVHLGGYAQELEDDYRTESQAAVSGGVTTFFHYLFHDASYLDVFSDTVRAAETNSCVDVAFHIGIVNEEQIEELAQYAEQLGIRSFKMLMAYKGREARSRIRGLDDGQIFQTFQRIANVESAIAVVHAENMEVINALQKVMIPLGRQDTAAWSECRPAFAELDAIRRVMTFASETGVKLVVPHLSVGVGSEFIKRHGVDQPPVYVETCPHYLLLHKDLDLKVLGKVNPPLRERAQVSALWERVFDGTVDFLGSDHVPHTRTSKGDDLWTAKPGLSGMTMTLPILLSEGVHGRGLPLTKVVELTSFRAAKIFQLHPKKGALEVGSDADIVILDLEKRVEITPEVLNSVSDYTPYQGYICQGWPHITVSNGRVVYREGRIVDLTSRGHRLLPGAVPC